MDNVAAQKVLHEWVTKLRSVAYRELASRVDSVAETVIRSRHKLHYGEVQVLWDDEPEGNIRVVVSVDDGGLRAFVPITESFVKSPTGDFVGE